MTDVVILDAKQELTQIEFGILNKLVSPEKQERLKRFNFYKDACNTLLGDILARTEICRVTGLGNNTLEFSANTYGKPFLVNDPRIHYNISHTGNYVVCAMDNQPVGIDIELIKPIDLKIPERFFTPDEVYYIISPQDDLVTHRFYEVWTKKESRIKLEGKGLSMPLSSFDVFDDAESGGIYYHLVFRNDEAICYLCSLKKEKPNVRIVDINILMRQIR